MYVRLQNDAPELAPSGHTVVQVMLPATYSWWATRGSSYNAEKDLVAQAALELLEPLFPELRPSVRVTDIVTPLTYWSMARSWRGAYEGWMPSGETGSAHIERTLAGLHGFYMAGQWVEPGGGVPMALMSGRQAVQQLCIADERVFSARGRT